MDTAPTHRDRVHAGRLRRPDVERRVADVDGFPGRAAELLDREENGVGIGLVPLRVLVGDDDVERARERREAVERERDGSVPLGGHDAELPPLGLEARKEREELVERLERLVEAVVVLLVRLEQLVGMLRVDRRHLRDDPLAADGQTELVRRDLPPEHGAHGVLHRGEDDRPRVDQRAVEVEEDDAEAHVRRS